MSKSLILYFSRAGMNYYKGKIVDLKVGNTKVLASKIHQMLESDLFEIESIKEYAFDYHECTDESANEYHANARPEVKTYLDSLEPYNKIILAYPNWWNTMPMVVWTFLEHYDFSNKTIYPICTHEGSGLGVSVQDIQNCCTHSKVDKGLAIKGSRVENSDQEIKNWLIEKGLI